MSALAIQHDERAHRFTAPLDGLVAQLDYELAPLILSITHTRVPPQFRGRGVAAELMAAALAYAQSQGLTVNPVCSYAVAYLQRAGERKHQEDLLDEALDESFPASDTPAVGGVS